MVPSSQVAHALAGIFARLDDADLHRLTRQHHRLERLGHRVNVDHIHTAQRGDFVEIEVVGHDAAIFLLGQQDELLIDPAAGAGFPSSLGIWASVPSQNRSSSRGSALSFSRTSRPRRPRERLRRSPESAIACSSLRTKRGTISYVDFKHAGRGHIGDTAASMITEVIENDGGRGPLVAR